MNKVSEKIRKQTKVWTTKFGMRMRICDMTDTHLLNTLMFLYDKACGERESTMSFYLNCTPPTADMAEMLFEQEFDRAMESEWYHYLPRIFDNLYDEAKRRDMVLPQFVDEYGFARESE